MLALAQMKESSSDTNTTHIKEKSSETNNSGLFENVVFTIIPHPSISQNNIRQLLLDGNATEYTPSSSSSSSSPSALPQSQPQSQSQLAGDDMSTLTHIISQSADFPQMKNLPAHIHVVHVFII
jgi:hypothetical protein